MNLQRRLITNKNKRKLILIYIFSWPFILSFLSAYLFSSLSCSQQFLSNNAQILTCFPTLISSYLLLIFQTRFSIIDRQIMEIKHQTSEKSSEISYMRLQNTKDLQTPQESGILNKQAFLKHLLQVNVGKQDNNNQENQSSSFNYQSDQGFINELFQIIQKHQSQPEKMEDKKQLDEETCQQIHQICMKHRQASKFNIYSAFQPSKIPTEALCKCGCGRAEGQPLSICTDELQHYFFGPTILIFFCMRKMVILLVVIALIYGVYSIITNAMEAPELGDRCKKPGMLAFLCPLKMLVSTVEKINNSTLMQIQVWLGLLMCVIWILGTRIIRSMGRILNKKIDSLLDSSSDYVIQIYNLPYGGYSQNQLIQYIGSLWKSMKGKNCKLPGIKSVQIIYQMDQARKMIKKIIQNACKLAGHLNKRQIEGKTIYQIKEGHLETYLCCKMELIKSMIKIEEYRDKFINNQEFRKQLSTDIAFIQFADSNDQSQILNEIKQYRITMLGELKEYIMSKIFTTEEDSYTFKGNSIRITRAPQPSDINWSNCQKKNSYKRIALVWLIALCMVGISFGFLTFIRYLRSTFVILQDLSILVSISLQAFNRGIWNTLITVISLQQNNTKTDNIISIMSKGAFAQAINVLVLPLMFNYVMKKNIYGPEGLISSTIDYHFTFVIMQTFLTLLNIPYQFSRITIYIPCVRNWLIRTYSNVVGVVDTSQQIKQLLAYYETPSFNIASAYTSMNTIIFHTVFYIHVQPFLIFSLIFNICFVYFMHKYLLLRRYKIPELVDFIIFENSLSYLQHVPLIYAAGSITFMHLIEPQTQVFNKNFIPSIICVFLWLFCVLNPFSILNKLTKRIIGIFGYSENQTEIKETGCSSVNMAEDLNSQDSSQNRIFKRRQCYYNGCGTNDLLQYEAKLTEVKRSDEYQNLNKLFCEKFNLKPSDKVMQLTWNEKKVSGNKKSSMRMLPRMKQSFAIVKQQRNLNSQTGKKNADNNRILPIDIYKFGEQKKGVNLMTVEQEKQNKVPKKKMMSKISDPRKEKDINVEKVKQFDTKNRLMISSANNKGNLD